MINVLDEKNCCSCGACVNACPTQAISFKENEFGFKYPNVSRELCINCNKCVKVCPMKADFSISLKETYVCMSNSTDPLKSASGGAFSGIAKEVLENNGVVFGCAMFNENGKFVVKHIGISNEKELELLQGSKYIQSDLTNTYKDIEKLLKSEKTVLFSGTPCQVAGLKKYLIKEYENLYTIDIVCHGVPSQKIFNDYISQVESQHKIQIHDFKFRDKSHGWKLFGKINYTKCGQETIEQGYFEPEESSYYHMFLESEIYMESCYGCKFASEYRSGDITIGDYWCIELVHPELMKNNGGGFEEKKGVSCLIINNDKGKKLLEDYGKGLYIVKSSYENASKYNGQLKYHSKRTNAVDTVKKLYSSQGYKALENRHYKWLIKYKFKRKIIALIPKGLKDFRRKILK